jgi:hypothetical protein
VQRVHPRQHGPPAAGSYVGPDGIRGDSSCSKLAEPEEAVLLLGGLSADGIKRSEVHGITVAGPLPVSTHRGPVVDNPRLIHTATSCALGGARAPLMSHRVRWHTAEMVA